MFGPSLHGLAELKPNFSSSLSSIRVLPALFKLIRILFSLRYDGSLKTINAILGASVIWPDVMNNNDSMDIFDELEDDHARQVLVIYFYTVNFWRECISAFVSQDDPTIRGRVLTRLTQTIELEEKIREIMETAPEDYVPPVCAFLSESSSSARIFKKPAAPAKRAKKRKANEENINSEEATFEAEVSVPRKKASGMKFDSIRGQNEHFRQMDPHILILFEHELSTEFPPSKERAGQVLGLQEFRFLMEDFITKVESIHGVHRYGAANSQDQNIMYLDAYLSDVIQLLPKIVEFHDQLVLKLNTLVSDGAEETFCDPFNDESNYIKCSFGLCVRLLATLFTWPGFNEDEHKELLSGALQAIGGGEAPSITEKARASLAKITANANLVSKLETAVFMLDLSKALTKYLPEENVHNDVIVPMCEQFLSRVWHSNDGTEARSAESNAHLEKILQSFFKGAKISLLSKQLTWIVADVKDFKGKNFTLKTFPCFRK